MNIKQILQQQFAKAIKEEFNISMEPEDIHLERPQDESHGDWSSNIGFILGKQISQDPYTVAQRINHRLTHPLIYRKKTINGFANIHLQTEHYIDTLVEILKENKKYGTNSRLKDKRLMVEFAHPNPFKAFHIGHLRNIILGESLVRLLESQGAKVIRTNYQGDVGMHIAKNIWAFKKIDPKDYPETTDERVTLLGKLYAEGATAFEENDQAQSEIREINKKIYSKEDPEINKLWDLGKKWSLEKFHEIYERVYTNFDREYMETETLDTCMKHVERALKKGILEKSQGAIIFNGEPHGLDTRVFVNSEGLPTYEGKELGLAYMEFKDFGELDLLIYNVAVEHNSFYQVTFKVKELLDPKLFKGKQYHNAYEFVGLKGGKMSSRKGNVVLGDEILTQAHNRIEKIVKEKSKVENIDEISEIIGIGAVKCSFLRISPFKYLAFDLEESLNFEGDSGPYLQYTYARAKSILREVGEQKPKKIPADTLTSDHEIALLKWLERFPEVVEIASSEYTPNDICTYLFELAQRFNSFYKQHQVLKAEREEDKLARLALTQATSIVIEKGLDLLGIKTVEKM